MSSSSWGTKLERNLSKLAETSSKESLQATARWFVFNRKFAGDFCDTLANEFSKASEGRKALLVCLINEVLLWEKTHSSKWDKLADLRIQLGETVLLPAADTLGEQAVAKVEEFLEEWDDANVFGGPTLINQIRRKISTRKEAAPVKSEPQPTTKTEAPKSVKQEGQEPPAVSKTKEQNKPREETKPVASVKIEKPSEKRASIASIREPYDFESKGIPAAPVDTKELLESCRAISSLQIARDLRNDGAVQLSSLLSAMPEDVRRACAEAAEDPSYELTDDQARDLSEHTNEILLNSDLNEQLENVQTFRDVVDRQRKARLRLIRLMIQSRCKFGADVAAAAFMQAETQEAEFKKRAQILQDAMELEGLDVEQTKQEPIKELAPLAWYQPEKEEATPDAKRQRVS